MRYKKIKGVDYLEIEGNFHKVERQYHSDPDNAGSEIARQMLEQVSACRQGLTIIGIADSKLTLLGFHSDNDVFTLQLGEVRTDGVGMLLEEELPEVKGNAVLPIMQLTGGVEFADLVEFENQKPFGSVVDIAQTSIKKEFDTLRRRTIQ